MVASGSSGPGSSPGQGHSDPLHCVLGQETLLSQYLPLPAFTPTNLNYAGVTCDSLTSIPSREE